MSFSNPTTVTINAVDYDCVRINMDNYQTHYRLVNAGTDQLDLKIRHSSEGVKNGVNYDRHNVDLTWTVFSGDPDVANTVYQAYVVLRNPTSEVGNELPYLGNALSALLASGTVLADLVGWQS